MNPSELSILSDDLRPRDTPNHTLLKDFALKPLVPDLSITEKPASEEPIFHKRYQQVVSSQENCHFSVSNGPKPLVEEYKTYSEWRKKSAQNVKTQSATRPSHDNAYIRHVNGLSSPSVLDNLNTSVALQKYGDHSVAFPNGRPHMAYSKESQGSETTSKVSQADSNLNFPRTDSQRKWEAAKLPKSSQRRESPLFLGTEEASPRHDSYSEVGHRKSCLGSSCNSNSSQSTKNFVSNQAQFPNCVGCVHWPHQLASTINCNCASAVNSFGHHHGGMPSCNAMPAKLGSSRPTVTVEQPPKAISAPRHFGALSGHSFHDSVVYDNLYQIVLSQSEQLKLLQTQVEKILISQENHLCNESSERGNQIRPSTIVVERGTQTSNGESDRGDNEKVSIEVMTSLIHTVAYAGRVGLVDSKNKGFNQAIKNTPVEAKSKMKNGCNQSTCTSPIQSLLTSSPPLRSDLQSSPPSGTLKCCKCHSCADAEKKNQKKKKVSKHNKRSQMDQLAETLGSKGPGVSTAIRTVRGCQAALENESLPNGCDVGRSGLGQGVDESIALNNKAELPSIDLPESPPSSVHLELQAYQGSSSDPDGSDSDDEERSSYESDIDESDSQLQRLNGWNLNHNNSMPENRHLEHGDNFGGDLSPGMRQGREARPHKEYHPPRPTANNGLVNSILKRVAFQQEPKSSDDSEDSLKQASLQYLRDNYPEELVSSGGFRPGRKSSVSRRRVEDTGFLNVENNMSIATYRYLHRYNLLPEGHNMDLDEERAGYSDNVLSTNTASRAGLTNGSPNRGYRGYAVASHFEQHVNAGQYGMRTGNGKDCMSKDNTGRPNPVGKHNPAHFESPSGRKHSSKGHHKRHMTQTNPAQVSHSNAQRRATKVLDVTALHQQDTLQWNKNDARN